MGQSNEDWGSAPTDTHADAWDAMPELPQAGDDKLFDAFLESKALSREDLTRIGTRWTSRDGHANLVWMFPDGFKYRRLHDAHRESEKGVTWKHFKRIRSPHSATEAVIAEGETDGATLARLLPKLDVLILPNGAKNVTPEMISLAGKYAHVYVGTDNDEAGNDAAVKFMDKIPHATRIVPPQGKDWCEAAAVGAVAENFDLSGVASQGAPSVQRWPLRVPVTVDFDAPLPRPDWVVEGLIETGTVTILSADTGAGKSIVANGLVYSILSGESWLNRVTTHVPIVLIDEENSTRLITKRLQAFGVTNRITQGLTIYNRIGCELGKEDWNVWLRAVERETSAGLIIIDTVGACTTAEVNNNDAVVQLYKRAFRPLTEHGAAVLLLHHERKDRLGEQRMPGQAMMGARQWAGQADAHIVLTRVSDPAYDAATNTRTTQVTMEVPKTRDGNFFQKESIKIWSQLGGDQWEVDSMQVVSEGAAPEKDHEYQRLAQEMQKALVAAGRPLTTAELKRHLEFHRSDTLWTTAREFARSSLGVSAEIGSSGGAYVFCASPSSGPDPEV